MVRFSALLVACSLWSVSGQVHAPPQSDIRFAAERQQDFIRFDPHYTDLRASYSARARFLANKVFSQERSGRDTACAHQMLLQIAWRLRYTATFGRIDHELNELQHLISHPDAKREAMGREQNSEDGSWGGCQTEWFLRLETTVSEYLPTHSPTYALRFLDRINSPEKLRAYFDSIVISDIARYGVDHNLELNHSSSDLLRLILRDKPAGYHWAPGMKEAILNAVSAFRNPQTGWWGERYVHNGHVEFVDNLSITFHMVSYQDGNVSDLGRVIDTTLAVKELNEPSGWLANTSYNNHNNMDVAVLFRYGWQAATIEQRRVMADELTKMLRWCLTDSLQPDGSFLVSMADEGSPEEAEYYGTAFLARIGFFSPKQRFWTKESFPQADEVRQRLKAYIERHVQSGAAGGSYYKSALEDLAPN